VGARVARRPLVRLRPRQRRARARRQAQPLEGGRGQAALVRQVVDAECAARVGQRGRQRVLKMRGVKRRPCAAAVAAVVAAAAAVAAAATHAVRQAQRQRRARPVVAHEQDAPQ